MEAFRISPFAVGLDLNRSVIKEALGNYVVDSSTPTVFRAGMIVQQNTSNQLIEVCTGAIPFGFAKFNRSTVIYSTVVGEYIQLNGTTATALKYNNLFNPGTNGGVRVAAALTGSSYTKTTDYTVQHAAGTITRNGGGSIPDGGYVYVNYMHQLGNNELKYEGYNFWNAIDDTQFQDDRITVITDWSTLFTANYDTEHTYTVGQQLYAGRLTTTKSGLVCGDNTEGLAYVGRCFQIPTVDDPFLGIKFVGGMVS